MADTREISISFSCDIVYVTGAVNGVDKVFTLTDGLWQTTADRTENDVYEVEITAVNTLGNTSTLKTTLYYGLHLVTDRTYSDVLEGTEKGFYNDTDLNRVESAAEYIAARLADAGYYTTLRPKTLWDKEMIPSKEEMARYLANVYICVRQTGAPAEQFSLPETMDGLHYIGANNIEKCLEWIDEYLTKRSREQIYAGEIFAGEEWNDG